MAHFPNLDAATKRRLAERGIDAERSCEMMLAEIRAGLFILEPRLRRCEGCEIDYTYGAQTVGCNHCVTRAYYARKTAA